MTTMRTRPIFGGVFGNGRYCLATMACIARGLHAVRYMVIEPRAGSVLSVAEEKTEALQSARRLLRATEALTRIEERQAKPQQEQLWPEDDLPPAAPGAKPAPRRRREIFERSNGRCFYCGTVLQLDGKWHIEHQIPRALDGDDSGINLVAACTSCNLAKSDRTALEFVATLQ
ncbi:MAG: HNH endonuclease [Rhodoferax sp.]|nr:HNH endonuclease [Rhodoferax sp.]